MRYLMKLNIGDWSDDGHGKCRSVIYSVDHPVHYVQLAYKVSCKITGIQFNHNEDYTGGKCKGYGDWNQLCTEYEDSTIMDKAFVVLKRHIHNLNEFVSEDGAVEDFENLWWAFIKISLPDLQYEEVKIDNINGYWGDLNVQFGYGLFN